MAEKIESNPDSAKQKAIDHLQAIDQKYGYVARFRSLLESGQAEAPEADMGIPAVPEKMNIGIPGSAYEVHQRQLHADSAVERIQTKTFPALMHARRKVEEKFNKDGKNVTTFYGQTTEIRDTKVGSGDTIGTKRLLRLVEPNEVVPLEKPTPTLSDKFEEVYSVLLEFGLLKEATLGIYQDANNLREVDIALLRRLLEIGENQRLSHEDALLALGDQVNTKKILRQALLNIGHVLLRHESELVISSSDEGKAYSIVRSSDALSEVPPAVIASNVSSLVSQNDDVIDETSLLEAECDLLDQRIVGEIEDLTPEFEKIESLPVAIPDDIHSQIEDGFAALYEQMRLNNLEQQLMTAIIKSSGVEIAVIDFLNEISPHLDFDTSNTLLRRLVGKSQFEFGTQAIYFVGAKEGRKIILGSGFPRIVTSTEVSQEDFAGEYVEQEAITIPPGQEIAIRDNELGSLGANGELHFESVDGPESRSAPTQLEPELNDRGVSEELIIRNFREICEKASLAGNERKLLMEVALSEGDSMRALTILKNLFPNVSRERRRQISVGFISKIQAAYGPDAVLIEGEKQARTIVRGKTFPVILSSSHASLRSAIEEDLDSLTSQKRRSPGLARLDRLYEFLKIFDDETNYPTREKIARFMFGLPPEDMPQRWMLSETSKDMSQLSKIISELGGEQIISLPLSNRDRYSHISKFGIQKSQTSPDVKAEDQQAEIEKGIIDPVTIDTENTSDDQPDFLSGITVTPQVSKSNGGLYNEERWPMLSAIGMIYEPRPIPQNENKKDEPFRLSIAAEALRVNRHHFEITEDERNAVTALAAAEGQQLANKDLAKAVFGSSTGSMGRLRSMMRSLNYAIHEETGIEIFAIGPLDGLYSTYALNKCSIVWQEEEAVTGDE